MTPEYAEKTVESDQTLPSVIAEQQYAEGRGWLARLNEAYDGRNVESFSI